MRAPRAARRVAASRPTSSPVTQKISYNLTIYKIRVALTKALALGEQEMPYTSEEDRVMHEAKLRRSEVIWTAYYGNMLHSDRAALDIGISALKTAILINAGALVALIAFITQVWLSEQKQTVVTTVIGACEFFVYGLVSASAVFLIAYLYQSAVTASFLPALEELPLSKKEPSKKLEWFIKLTRMFMILLGIGSLVCFVIGVREVLLFLEAA